MAEYMKVLLYKGTRIQETINGWMGALTSEPLKTTKWTETDGSDGKTAKSFKEIGRETRFKARES
jgi:hypothetical protein